MVGAVVLQTGQKYCYDVLGRQIPCTDSGQDGEIRVGRPWPETRFEMHGEIVNDILTGLAWTVNANPAEFPLSWNEALTFVRDLNGQTAFGYSDWRLPNRRELRSLISYQTKRPALPGNHPFQNVFLNWYWTSTTAAIHPAYAWYVHMDGARMFYGKKDQYFLVWPVRGNSSILPVTGQHSCFDEKGDVIACPDGFQDGAEPHGPVWPRERFAVREEGVLDRLTGLEWHLQATLTDIPLSWPEAFELVRKMNMTALPIDRQWRVPNINELESLIDCSQHSPALPHSHPFRSVKDVYWSSTTSFYETDWAWALYMEKGALGVGVKGNSTFYVWPVRDGST